MSTLNIVEKLKSLKQRHDGLLAKRAEATAEAKIKKEQLESLLAEMRDEGINPEDLDSELKKAEQDLLQAIAQFEAELEVAEKAFKINP